MIIDAHSHLRDILYPGGSDLIYRTNVQMENVFDPQGINEKLLMRHFGIGKFTYRLGHRVATKAMQARNRTATRWRICRYLWIHRRLTMRSAYPLHPMLHLKT